MLERAIDHFFSMLARSFHCSARAFFAAHLSKPTQWKRIKFVDSRALDQFWEKLSASNSVVQECQIRSTAFLLAEPKFIGNPRKSSSSPIASRTMSAFHWALTSTQHQPTSDTSVLTSTARTMRYFRWERERKTDRLSWILAPCDV